MREIGGYFALETLSGSEFYPELTAVNTARHALIYIMSARKAKKIYLPYFLCESVGLACKKYKIETAFYNIDRNFLPVFDKQLSNDEWLYIVNYYGQINNEKAKEFKYRFGNVIFDNVQAFFQKPVKGIDTVYSCRKFFGVPDGGYASTEVRLVEALPQDISMNRLRHLIGRLEGKSASDYYADFKANDHAFMEAETASMSLFTHNILRAINYDEVIEKRNNNFHVLSEKLGYINGIDLKVPIGPYAYPFYCKNGMEIKKRLAEKKIFVATLWPNVLEMDGTIEKDFAENILPLPCDQRYDEEEMIYVAEELKNASL